MWSDSNKIGIQNNDIVPFFVKLDDWGTYKRWLTNNPESQALLKDFIGKFNEIMWGSLDRQRGYDFHNSFQEKNQDMTLQSIIEWFKDNEENKLEWFNIDDNKNAKLIRIIEDILVIVKNDANVRIDLWENIMIWNQEIKEIILDNVRLYININTTELVRLYSKIVINIKQIDTDKYIFITDDLTEHQVNSKEFLKQ